MKDTIICPLMKNKEIDIYTCFEIHTVVDGTSPKSIAPKIIFDNNEFSWIFINVNR